MPREKHPFHTVGKLVGGGILTIRLTQDARDSIGCRKLHGGNHPVAVHTGFNYRQVRIIRRGDELIGVSLAGPAVEKKEFGISQRLNIGRLEIKISRVPRWGG